MKRKRIGKPFLWLLAAMMLAGWLGVAHANDIVWTIPDNSLTGRMLADLTIGTAKLARRSVTADKIGIRAVTNGHLANNAVNSYKVKDGTIGSADVTNNSITGADIRSGTVTQANAPFAIAGASSNLRVETGQITLNVDAAGQVGPVTATFAKPFATAPLVIASFSDIAGNMSDYAGTSVVDLVASGTTTQVSVKARVTDPGLAGSTAKVSWMAIGK